MKFIQPICALDCDRSLSWDPKEIVWAKYQVEDSSLLGYYPVFFDK